MMQAIRRKSEEDMMTLLPLTTNLLKLKSQTKVLSTFHLSLYLSEGGASSPALGKAFFLRGRQGLISPALSFHRKISLS